MDTIFILAFYKIELALGRSSLRVVPLGVWKEKPSDHIVDEVVKDNLFKREDFLRLMNGEEVKVLFGYYRLVEIETGINFFNRLERACKVK